MSPALRRRLAGASGELFAAGSALLLATSMFALEWYGTAGPPGSLPSWSGVSGAESAWAALTILRWPMLGTIAGALAAAILRLSRRSRATRVLRRGLLRLAAATSLLLVYRVLIVLPAPDRVVDQKLGAYLGLLGAVGVACGAYGSRP